VKFSIDMHSLAKVSVLSRQKVNANFPDQPLLDDKGKPVYEEDWHEVPYGVAIALQDIDRRICALENLEKTAVIKPARKPKGTKRRVVKE